MISLAFIADIAGLLGFSMQIIDKYREKYGRNEEGEIIGLLIALSDKSLSVKKVHTKYHSLYLGLSTIDSFLKGPNGSTIYRTVNDLNRRELLKILSNYNIPDACYQLEDDLRTEIGDLDVKSTDNSAALIDKIAKINHGMGSCVRNILARQYSIVMLHNDYLSFFSELRPMVYKPELSESDATKILVQRPFYSVHYNAIIHNTDEVLMNYLDLYNKTIEYIK